MTGVAYLIGNELTVSKLINRGNINCYDASGEITGVVMADVDATVSIEDCINEGIINIENIAGDLYLAGVVRGQNSAEATECYNKGNINISGTVLNHTYTQIVGVCYRTSISNSSNMGDITVDVTDSDAASANITVQGVGTHECVNCSNYGNININGVPATNRSFTAYGIRRRIHG